MLRAGAILLTLWTGLSLVIAFGVLFSLLVLGKNSPALLVFYDDVQATGIDPRALTTINAACDSLQRGYRGFKHAFSCGHLARACARREMGVLVSSGLLVFSSSGQMGERLDLLPSESVG